MMPITEFLSCTEFIEDFDCFSYQQKHHARTYLTGLIASGNKTVEGISKRVLQSKSERALNKFFNQYAIYYHVTFLAIPSGLEHSYKQSISLPLIGRLHGRFDSAETHGIVSRRCTRCECDECCKC